MCMKVYCRIKIKIINLCLLLCAFNGKKKKVLFYTLHFLMFQDKWPGKIHTLLFLALFSFLLSTSSPLLAPVPTKIQANFNHI